MPEPTRARVLDVGNCHPDHAMIRKMLERHFDVDIERVMFVDEALERMQSNAYQLVLFNRLIFEDGSDGIELLKQSRMDTASQHTPVMMISNFDFAQAASVSAGGVPGFGKDAIFEPQTIKLLSQYLPLRRT